MQKHYPITKEENSKCHLICGEVFQNEETYLKTIWKQLKKRKQV